MSYSLAATACPSFHGCIYRIRPAAAAAAAAAAVQSRIGWAGARQSLFSKMIYLQALVSLDLI
jgi:hypothetical protein